MPTIAVVSPRGGTGKSALTECLRQVYIDAQIVDGNHQQTLTILSHVSNEPLPVKKKEATAKYIIYDTPPYNDEEIRELIRNVGRVLVPIKGAPPDLAASPVVYTSLKNTKAFNKTLVVLNEVRKPITNVHKKVVSIFSKKFLLVKMAKTYLSNLGKFKNALMGELLDGEALAQIKSLIEELQYIIKIRQKLTANNKSCN